MDIKKTIGGLTLAGALAGGAILGGIEVQKQEVRNYRMGLIERLEFTKNNQELCRESPDERCATFNDFNLYIEESNKVKNVEVGGEKKSFEDKLKDKLLK